MAGGKGENEVIEPFLSIEFFILIHSFLSLFFSFPFFFLSSDFLLLLHSLISFFLFDFSFIVPFFFGWVFLTFFVQK